MGTRRAAGAGVVGKFPLFKSDGRWRDDAPSPDAPPEQSPAAAMVAGQLHAGAFRYQSATDHLPITELSGRFTFVPGSMRRPSGEVFEIAVGPVPCEPPAFLY